jgi:hypothetical protein
MVGRGRVIAPRINVGRGMGTSRCASPRGLKIQRAPSGLAFVPALLLAMLFVAGHASAAVHVKSRSHRRTSSRRVRAHRPPGVHGKSVKRHKKKSTARKHSTNRTTSRRGSSSVGTILFDGSSLSSWWLNQSATPTRVQIVPDPDGAANTAQQFTTYNTDVYPLTPTANPRSQLVTPTTVLTPGNTYWESFEVFVPQNFTFLSNGWVSLETAAFGYPYAGSPPVELSTENGDFRFQRNGFAPTPWQIAWSTPVVKGQWYRFTWHFLFSAAGWVELYVNDVQQRLKVGTTSVSQLPIAMLDPTDSTGPWISDEQLYYELGNYQSTSVYFKNFKIATTQAAAES